MPGTFALTGCLFAKSAVSDQYIMIASSVDSGSFCSLSRREPSDTFLEWTECQKWLCRKRRRSRRSKGWGAGKGLATCCFLRIIIESVLKKAF